VETRAKPPAATGSVANVVRAGIESGEAPRRALLGFAAAVFVFHHVPTFAGDAADWIDLFTPLGVVGAAGWLLLALRARPEAVALAVLAALLYVDGHGIHLAANSIAGEGVQGTAKSTAHFWDEEWGHAEWHLGLIGLVCAFCLPERARSVKLGWAGVASAVLLGWTLFTSTVEGGTWWLELGATAVLVVWAFRARRPIVLVSASAFTLGALLIGIWAIWQGGVPQFSDVGWV
jgi:hypothetical protein